MNINRKYTSGFENGGCLFIRGGNSLSGKDPRGKDEIASVGYFTGAGNIVVFIGPWPEAEARYESEIVDIQNRIASLIEN